MANIYFEHIELKNFMSYAHTEIDLNRQGNILVGGKNLNPEDAAKSNGSGKSSLFSALLWCLTGETVNGSVDVSNIYTKGKTEVTVTFKIDNIDYKITRTKNPSNLFIYINGENKSGKGIRDTSKLLLEYIPQLTPSLLNSVIILGQGLPQRFTNNTPSGRKDVLEKLSNSEFMIEDLKEKLTKRKNSLDQSKRNLEDDNLKNETLINQYNQETKRINDEIISIPSKDLLIKDIDEFTDQINDLNIKLAEISEDIEKIEKVQEDINNKLESERTLYMTEFQNLELEDESNLIEQKAKLDAEYNHLIDQIIKYESVLEVCPTCGRKFDGVHKIDTTDLHKQVDDINDIRPTVEAEIKALRWRNKDKQDKCKEEYENKINSYKSEIYSYSIKRNDKYVELNKYTLEKTDLIKKVENIKRQLLEIDKEKELKEKRLSELKDEINNLTEKVYNNNEELSVIVERLAINSKMMTLIKRDFRGYLINNIILFIEEKAKAYSQEVFGTDKLSFALEGNNINISYDGKDYSCLSGGERQKLDIIIQFAIRDMLCTFLGFSSNILVLDEITDALDIIGVNKIFDLIGSHLQDVEATYIISHHIDELEIPADDEIIIIKGDDKISRIL